LRIDSCAIWSRPRQSAFYATSVVFSGLAGICLCLASTFTDLMEEIHDDDRSLRDGWPFHYWAKEPFEASRRDATIRYASAFRI